MHTANGGTTWQALRTSVFPGDARASAPHGIPYSGDKSGVTFISARTGWVAGGAEAPGTLIFMRTTNGGRSFVPQSLPAPPGYVIGNANPPVFPTPSVGWTPLTVIRNGVQALGFARTTDAGQTWQAIPAVFAGFPPGGLAAQPAWSFVDRQWGWVLSQGTLYRTHDGGQQWPRVAKSPVMARWVGLDFLSPTDGWAFGTGRNALWQTTDGGQQWHLVQALLQSKR